MIGVFKWGWGEEGKSVAFWGWADSAVILNDFICVLDKTEKTQAVDISRRGVPNIVCCLDEASKIAGRLRMSKFEGSTAQTKNIQHGSLVKNEMFVRKDKLVSDVTVQRFDVKEYIHSIGDGRGLRAGLVKKISEQKVNKK